MHLVTAMSLETAQLGRRQSPIEERMAREGRLLIGFCSFSFVRPCRTVPFTALGYTGVRLHVAQGGAAHASGLSARRSLLHAPHKHMSAQAHVHAHVHVHVSVSHSTRPSIRVPTHVSPRSDKPARVHSSSCTLFTPPGCKRPAQRGAQLSHSHTSPEGDAHQT